MESQRARVKHVYQWSRTGVAVPGLFENNLSVADDFSWLRDKLHHQESVIKIRPIDPETTLEEETLSRRLAAKSLLIVPLVYHEELLGLVGLGSDQDGHSWSKSDEALLKIVGQIITNALAHKRSAEELTMRNLLLTKQQEVSPGGILVVDENGKFISYNQRFLDLCGIPEDMITSGWTRRVIRSLMAQMKDTKIFLTRVKECQHDPAKIVFDEFQLRNGQAVSLYTAPMIGSDGIYYGRIWFFQDITDRKLAEERIKHLANHDSLTGLVNRRFLNELFDHFRARATRYLRQMAIFYLDLDNFKPVNDRLGHRAGDEVLRMMAQRIRSSLRDMDTAARVGGDEFVIISEDLNNYADAGIIAEKIMGQISLPCGIDGDVCHLGVSIGISIFPFDGDELDTLIRKADAAMYRIKESGKGGYLFFEPTKYGLIRT
ncbi:MAG: diguanylate cyclase [Deltaproteobacteria bacterium]|nr:diguanylate cyclase [Deltaproteobacteria bacterium]